MQHLLLLLGMLRCSCPKPPMCWVRRLSMCCCRVHSRRPASCTDSWSAGRSWRAPARCGTPDSRLTAKHALRNMLYRGCSSACGPVHCYFLSSPGPSLVIMKVYCLARLQDVACHSYCPLRRGQLLPQSDTTTCARRRHGCARQHVLTDAHHTCQSATHCRGCSRAASMSLHTGLSVSAAF